MSRLGHAFGRAGVHATAVRAQQRNNNNQEGSGDFCQMTGMRKAKQTYGVCINQIACVL
jgi:hypothetical protein